MSDTFPALPSDLFDDQPFTDDELDAYLDALDDAPVEPFTEDNGDGTVDVGIVRETVGLPAKVAAWRIEDRQSAEWAARKFAEYQAQLDQIAVDAAEFRRQLAEQLARVNEWERDAVKAPERSRLHFEALLTSYLQELREASAFPNKKTGEIEYKVKSLPLPTATVTSRKVPATVKLPEDKETKTELVEVIERLYPKAVKVTKDITVTAVKDLPFKVLDDGRLVLEVVDEQAEPDPEGVQPIEQVPLPGVVRVEGRVRFGVELL
jgi:hypothetical protein